MSNSSRPRNPNETEKTLVERVIEKGTAAFSGGTRAVTIWYRSFFPPEARTIINMTALLCGALIVTDIWIMLNLRGLSDAQKKRAWRLILLHGVHPALVRSLVK